MGYPKTDANELCDRLSGYLGKKGGGKDTDLTAWLTKLEERVWKLEKKGGGTLAKDPPPPRSHRSDRLRSWTRRGRTPDRPPPSSEGEAE